MYIDVAFTAQECSQSIVEGKSAAVIDVLRATTVMTVALANGAAEIVACAGVEDAKQVRAQSVAGALLGGEREARRIPGFDLGNSPLEYSPDVVRGKRVIMTTTNGTQAIERAGEARALYIMSMLNVSAVARQLLSDGRDVVLVCAGTSGRFSLEDGICAAICMDWMLAQGETALSDGAAVLLDHYRNHRADIAAILAGTAHARRLVQNGFGEDLAYCFKQDTLDCVPFYEEGRLHI